MSCSCKNHNQKKEGSSFTCERKRFKDKVIIVTGGASGIGRATCLLLAKEGATLVIADLNEKEGRETLAMVEELGSKAIFVKVDVSLNKEVEEMVKKTVQTFGKLDSAVNNAGIGGYFMKLHQQEEEMFDKLTAINLKGVFLCMKHEIKQMLIQKVPPDGFTIVNTSSISGLVAYRQNAPYAATKSGVIALTKSAAMEYSRSNIRINSVCPAFTDTPMISATVPDHNKEDFVKKLSDRVPMHRLGRPEEIASTIAFLLSSDSSFTTGSYISIDGGLSVL